MLNIKKDGTYLDATAGGGGHGRAILERLSERGVLICSDRDEYAVEKLTGAFDDERVYIRKMRFSRLYDDMVASGVDAVDGILLDLGVSMFQLKDKERGFSFDSDALLDMRMDMDLPVTARHIVNRYRGREIEAILKDYSDERLHKRIAGAIVRYREKNSIDTCRELADIVAKVYGGRGRIHPATRTFQALRIEVNNELEELGAGLENSVRLLRKGGRLCVISYHSIEDRIVKHFFKKTSKEEVMLTLTKKPVTAGREEVRQNPSSRSAKLRGAERL